MPSWVPESWNERLCRTCCTVRARRSPSAARVSISARSTVTSPNSAATKNALAAVSSAKAARGSTAVRSTPSMIGFTSVLILPDRPFACVNTGASSTCAAPPGYRLGMSLPDEFLLLAYDEDGTPLTDGTRLDNGLGGAILLELALARRLDIEDKRGVVLDPRPIGDALSDEALARIGEERARKPGHWVTKLSKQARPRILEKLVAEGVLTVEKDRVLWVFPRTKYPSANGEPPAAEADARERIRAAVLGTGEVEPRT